MILAAPITGAAEPLCHAGKFLRALQGLPDTTTISLPSQLVGGGAHSPANPRQHSATHPHPSCMHCLRHERTPQP